MSDALGFTQTRLALTESFFGFLSFGQLEGPFGDALFEGGVRSLLGELCEMGLMIAEDDRFLGLAQPVNANW